MSATLIDRIEIRKDGVYLSTHSPDDVNSYRTWQSEELSEAYQRDGQKGLDREMFRIFYEYAELGDFHKSTARYHRISNLPEAKALHRECFDRIDAFEKSCQSPSKFRAYDREMREKLYDKLAEKCGEYDKKQKNKDYER
jgi:hypothetical protein